MAKTDTEEVNLLDILASIFSAFKRNLALTVALPLLGAAIGLGIAFQSQALFESSLLIETTLLSQKESEFLFEQLEKVGTIPGVSKEQYKDVKGFKFEVIKDENTNNQTNNDLTTFNEKSLFLEVTAIVFNEDVFPALEKAIVSFINNSPSVLRHRKEREQFYSAMISRIDGELAAMEVIKKNVNSTAQASSLNPADLYANTVLLYKERTQYEIKREQVKVVHLIKGFDTLTYKASRNKVLAGLIGFGLGVLILCVILFTKFFLGYYKVYESTH